MSDENQAELNDDVPPTDANLMQRILWVRDRVTRLGKDADVGSGNYAYKAITHDKVTAFIRPKMVQAGIGSLISCEEYTDTETGLVTDKGRKVFQHRAKFAITFFNAFEQSDQITIYQVAYADDHGDKAPGKATSYAMKYAMLKTFMIETGEEDEERDDGPDLRGAKVSDDEDMLANLWAVADELFGDEAKEMLSAMAKRRFFVESYGDIPQDRYPDALRSLRVKRSQTPQKENDDENKS